jgi:hypothetical protein
MARSTDRAAEKFPLRFYEGFGGVAFFVKNQ